MNLKKGAILLFLLGQCLIWAQQDQCGSIFSEEQVAHFKVLKTQQQVSQRSNEIKYIPVKFHAVANADGSSRVRLEKVFDQLCAINENFAPLAIQFYLKDGTINEVNDNTIFNNPSSAAGTIKMAGEKNEFGANAINIFITDKAGTSASGDGTTLGYYDFNQDLIVLKKSAVNSNDQIRFVLGHELGHFFSLPHTFRGWDRDPWDGTPVTSSLSPGGVLNELADASNCDVAGDMICDTPADYNLGFGWDGCRIYDGGCTDPNGALLDPDETNFMGYFIGCDEYQFSPQQQEIVQNDYASARRSYLRVNFTPNTESIEDLPALLSPKDDETTPFYNGVHLEWTPVENATHYFVELTFGLQKLYYITPEAAIFITDLDEDKGYRWRVKPYNSYSTCADYSASFNFRTGTMTTSTKDIDLEEQVRLFPNPSDGTVISFIAEEFMDSGNLDVRLFNSTGSLIFAGTYSEPLVRIDHLNLENGIYFIKIKNGEKNVSKKFIVQQD